MHDDRRESSRFVFAGIITAVCAGVLAMAWISARIVEVLE